MKRAFQVLFTPASSVRMQTSVGVHMPYQNQPSESLTLPLALCFLGKVGKMEEIKVSRPAITRKRVVLAFNDPYAAPLDRTEMAALVDYHADGAERRARVQFWEEMYRLLVLDSRKLRLLNRYRVLNPADREGIASDQFLATRTNLLVGLWKARLWYDLYPEDLDWQQIVDAWLEKRKCYALSGSARRPSSKERTQVHWILTPPDVGTEKRVIEGQRNDFESFVSYFTTGVDRRSNTKARRECQRQGLLVEFDDGRGISPVPQ
jgi:hypothetical protein